MTSIDKNIVSSDLLKSVNGPSTSTSKTEDTQNRFLTLLVSQMKNQDPLNPMDNAQVTSQLAQLSTVSGIDKLNKTLETMMASFQSTQSLQATNLIGHGVLTTGSSLSVSSAAPAQFGIDLATKASAVTVQIKDAAGAVVRTLNMENQNEGITAAQWDGKNNAGVEVPFGKYVFNVSASDNGQKVDASTLSFAAVTSVSTGAKGVKLNTQELGQLGLADVSQIL